MNDLITIQGLQDALNLSMREVKDLQFEIAVLKTQLERMDRQWNKTIDAYEVTKSRLALYENEVGIPHNKGIADHRLNG